jgi:hypothetical protein
MIQPLAYMTTVGRRKVVMSQARLVRFGHAMRPYVDRKS